MDSKPNTYADIKNYMRSELPHNDDHPLYRAIDANWLAQHLPERSNDPAEHFAERLIRDHLAEHPERAGQAIEVPRFYMMEPGEHPDITVRIELRPHKDGAWRRHSLGLEGNVPGGRLPRVRLEVALVLEGNVQPG